MANSEVEMKYKIHYSPNRQCLVMRCKFHLILGLQENFAISVKTEMA